MNDVKTYSAEFDAAAEHAAELRRRRDEKLSALKNAEFVGVNPILPGKNEAKKAELISDEAAAKLEKKVISAEKRSITAERRAAAHWNAWTDEAIKILIDMYLDGHTPLVIAERLGFKAQRVSDKLKNLKNSGYITVEMEVKAKTNKKQNAKPKKSKVNEGEKKAMEKEKIAPVTDARYENKVDEPVINEENKADDKLISQINARLVYENKCLRAQLKTALGLLGACGEWIK